jgi:hypothetical protein
LITHVSPLVSVPLWEEVWHATQIRAETWAHYLHIIDTLEMASAFGITVRPRLTRDEVLTAVINLDPYAPDADMQEIIDAWLPLTFAMNSLNRAMGSPDLYPFILSPTVVTKLSFVHDVVHGRKAG